VIWKDEPNSAAQKDTDASCELEDRLAMRARCRTLCARTRNCCVRLQSACRDRPEFRLHPELAPFETIATLARERTHGYDRSRRTAQVLKAREPGRPLSGSNDGITHGLTHASTSWKLRSPMPSHYDLTCGS
jgi:hypothetical protein